MGAITRPHPGNLADKTMGERIRAYRAARGLTQRELATLAGISQAAVNDFENGRRTRAQIQVMVRLARVLRTTVEDLVG